MSDIETYIQMIWICAMCWFVMYVLDDMPVHEIIAQVIEILGWFP